MSNDRNKYNCPNCSAPIGYSMERKKISAWVKINEVCTVHVTDIYKWLVGRTGQFEIIPDTDYPRNGKVIYECTLKTQTITTEWDDDDEQD